MFVPYVTCSPHLGIPVAWSPAFPPFSLLSISESFQEAQLVAFPSNQNFTSLALDDSSE